MQFVDRIRQHLGWCPNGSALRTAPVILAIPSAMANPVQPGSSGASGGTGRIRQGISIATGSIKALVRDKRLLWYSFLAAVVISFLIVAEGWNVTHFDYALPSRIFIPFGDSFLSVFDIRLFLIEGICLSCFTLLLAALVLYRKGNGVTKAVTIREGFDGVNLHTVPLTFLSVAMALVATVLLELTSQSQVIGKIELAISLTIFHIPYAYYIPGAVFSALYFSFEIMVINIVLFLLALYVVPVIVLEKKGLLMALAGSAKLMKKTWQELLGCVLIFGAIVLGVAAIALVIGQSPLLLNHDYDFFLSLSRGLIPMIIVCYGFLLACGILMAVGSTVVGIAITDLYTCGTTGSEPGMPKAPGTTAAETA
jgi:hypothetical protein